MELNSRTGAVTNEFGHYSLTLPAGEVLLQFSYVGYQSDTIRPQLRLHYHA
nr:carboxypeptidase-like regulatory domain-containing protein [uncultured Porphyromonas sp.]